MHDNHWKFWAISILQLWNKFSEKRKLYKKIEWGVQNWHITKNRVLPLTTFLFSKLCFSFGTSCIELIWCTNHQNVQIHTFRKHWSFTLGSFFPVSRFECGQNKECSRLFMHQKLIWMKEHIYSVKGKSQAGNIRVKYIMTTQKGQSRKKIS